MLDPVILVIVSLSLAYIFIGAAAHKWRRYARFVEIARDYRLLPAWALRPAALLIPGLEFTTGFLLLLCWAYPVFAFGAFPAAVPLAAITLLCVYMLAIGVNLLRGRRSIDCGCGAAEQKQVIGPGLLARNAVLIACAGLLLQPVASRALTWLDWTVILPATAVCCLLYNIVNHLLLNGESLRLLRRRSYS